MSEEALEAHMRAAHHERRRTELAGMRVEYQEIRYYGVAGERDELAGRAAARPGAE